MSKLLKVALGLATIWPLLYTFLFIGFVFSKIVSMSSYSGAPPDLGAPSWFMGLFALHLITMLLVMGLTVFYIVDVYRNERVAKDQKVLWAVIIFLGGFIGMPVYWYLYIWREPARVGGTAPSS